MDNTNGKAIASMVLGIVSLILILFGGSIIGIILAIVGVVLGNSVKRIDPYNGFAKAGRILSWIGLIICIVVTVLTVVLVGAVVSAIL